MLYETRNPHGGDIYGGRILLDYSANTNPYGTPEGVIRAMRLVMGDLHHYPDPYCRALVQAIAAHEGVEPQYVLCGNGAADLIYAWCRAVKPESAAELAPTFSEYALGLAETGCRVERYMLREEQTFALDEGFLDFLEEKKPQAVFLCSPNNPTGQVIEPRLLERILDFTREKGMNLFLDECFLDLADQGESMKSHLGDHPQLTILKAFTKSYGMAGVRLGYCLCGNAALLGKMAALSQPWNVSTLAQAAGVAALQEGEFLEMTRRTIVKERQWMQERLAEMDISTYPSCTNYILFRARPDLHEKLLTRGIAIRNCANYYGLGPGWYRIAVRLREENEMLMDAIGAYCGKE